MKDSYLRFLWMIGGSIFFLAIFSSVVTIASITLEKNLENKNINIKIENNHNIVDKLRVMISPNNEQSDSNSFTDIVEDGRKSSFGLNEYKCTGSCFCDKKIIDRRRSSAIVSKSVVFFVSAISTLFASKLSSDRFQGMCSKAISEDCDGSEIKSKVNDCEPVSKEKTIHKKSSGLRRYHCKGNCLPKQFKREKSRDMALDFGCEDLEIEGLVEIKTDEILFKHINLFASQKFQKEYLTLFCKRSSLHKYWYETPGGKNSQWRTIFLCVGGVKKERLNESIECRKQKIE